MLDHEETSTLIFFTMLARSFVGPPGIESYRFSTPFGEFSLNQTLTKGLRFPATLKNNLQRKLRVLAFADVICRAAGNRTRSLRTRSACTTGILRPEWAAL